MNVTLVILRLVHLFASVLWVGATFTMALFVAPTARAVGAEAGKFMTHFAKNSGMSKWLASAAGLTVLSGAGMYYILFGNGMAPMNVGTGLALNIGVLAGTIAFVLGIIVGRVARQVGELGAAMAAGGPPKSEQMDRMAAMQEKMARLTAMNGILMVIALAGMTLSEYFTITF